MFRVKICGITRREDALAVAQAGGDAIGLNFFAGSPRRCSAAEADAIVAALPPGVIKVGVFVNARADEIRAVYARLRLDLVQLHGDESPEFLRALRPLPVMRALRVSSDLAEVTAYLRACHRLMAMPRLLLLDTKAPAGQPTEQYGGTGTAFDWSILSRDRAALCGLPLVLAGGLNPDNVAAAITATRPWAVDTASGVEEAPGKKSAELVRQFIAAARLAFDKADVTS